MDVEELKRQPSRNDFDKYLPMFFEDRCNEALGSWNDEDPGKITYK